MWLLHCEKEKFSLLPHTWPLIVSTLKAMFDIYNLCYQHGGFRHTYEVASTVKEGCHQWLHFDLVLHGRDIQHSV